jgi:hypothetical protein
MASQELQTPEKSDPSKRAKLENSAPAPVPEPPITASVLASILNAFKAEFGSGMQNLVQEQLSSTVVQIAKLVVDTELRLDTQHRALETVVTSERICASQLEAQQAIIKQDIQTLRAALAVSERAPAGPPGTTSVVDGALVGVTTNNLIALAEISATLHDWIQGAGIATEYYDIRGGELANKNHS